MNKKRKIVLISLGAGILTTSLVVSPIASFLILKKNSITNWEEIAKNESIKSIVKEKAPFIDGVDGWMAFDNWGFDQTLKPILLKNNFKKFYDDEIIEQKLYDGDTDESQSESQLSGELDTKLIASYKLGIIKKVWNQTWVTHYHFIQKYDIHKWRLWYMTGENMLTENTIWSYGNFARKAFLAKPIDIIKQAKPNWLQQGVNSNNIVVVKNFTSAVTWNNIYDNQGQIKITLSFEDSKSNFKVKATTFVANFNYKPTIQPSEIKLTDGPQYNIKDWRVL